MKVFSGTANRELAERICKYIGVPLAQLRPRKVDAATKEAIEDWHYWVAMGYHY